MLLLFFSLFFTRLRTTFREPIFFSSFRITRLAFAWVMHACGVLHHKVLMPTATKCFISISLAKRVDAWCQQDIQFATTFARTLLNMNIPYSINYIRFYILCSGFFSYLVQFLHSRGLFCKHSLQYLVWIHFFNAWKKWEHDTEKRPWCRSRRVKKKVLRWFLHRYRQLIHSAWWSSFDGKK